MAGDGGHLVGQRAGTKGRDPVAQEIDGCPGENALLYVQLQSFRAGDENIVNVDKLERKAVHHTVHQALESHPCILEAKGMRRNLKSPKPPFWVPRWGAEEPHNTRS